MKAKMNHLKTKAMSLSLESFKLNSMRLDRVGKMNFQDLLRYKLNRDRILKFQEFNKICGISRSQWDSFRLENKENKLTCVIE